MDILRSITGIFLLLFIGYIFSNNKKMISLRTISAALLLQISLAAIMLYVPAGKWLLQSLSNGVSAILSYSGAGSSFIFAGLVGDKMNVLFGDDGFVFAFQVLPAIIFVTALIAVLYYLGVMKWIIHILAYIFQKTMRISKIESFAAVTTIFLGQNELPAILKPFISKMNRNELFTVMCSGMASLAGSMLIGYAGLGVPVEYLLAASLMAIPGGILFARLLSPATEPSQVQFDHISFSEKRPTSIIEAAANGAMLGLKIAVAVGAVVMAFIAIIAMINGIIGSIGHLFGLTGISLERLFGYLFSPLAYLMGVSGEQTELVGSLIGQKLAINEFVAYKNFSVFLKDPTILLDAKTIAVISFALCSFANFGSIAVVVGAFIAVAPQKASDIAQLGLRALLAATLSNLMSATIAGLFISLSGA
ncbi:NupC/NupG family nucleoside CNT transporter [Xenorhabdus szentirmaii]|uniref:Nucleoside permease n=1 Tax=Xenorhabdus szentirmaii DSM 16338 TaxID=1427518 RepID=W1ITK0_9GAMM|nr:MULTISPECIES: NupC/NupG family nucleoside CNT transporter [Xenorhabdus]MBD2803517.1 NupC/NupG family nucleoside CNT transporter [Xenorhabdus sp. ZM]PHM32880.1 nucleoside permease [Xenorhabdus szentirmaii DSM 16338]PHM40801.1 nucleoside permease [Xenorhabdus szentirmaii]CDL81822.1 putative pseudouridine transporter [Xenorhabdus szentirmaii DSM 16338]